MGWSGGMVEWLDGGAAFLSVVFSWKLPAAFQRAAWLKAQGYSVVVGGPAAYINPSYFDGVASVQMWDKEVVVMHNPEATFTSRGCIRKCPFCIVPKTEGHLVELADWPVRPIVCDNNLLACSNQHFDSVMDKLSPLVNIDFNQGLDARLLTPYHAGRLAALHTKVIRLAWDDVASEDQFLRAVDLLLSAGIRPQKVTVYCLIGYKDTPEDALYRLNKTKSMGLLPFPMRYQPLNTPRRNAYIGEHWTDRELKRFSRYWSKQIWLSKVPFEEYD